MFESSIVIWEKVLRLIKPEIAEISFNTWIKPSRFEKITDTSCIIYVANDIVKEMIAVRWLDLIHNALYITTSANFTIEIVVVGDEEEVEFIHKTTDQNPDTDDFLNTYINPKYTFDSFVVGGSNRFAHAASLAVAEAPATAYNPLFLYGPPGLGKTHLIHAIANYIRKSKPTYTVVAVSSEKFTNDFIKALGDNKIDEFRAKYRRIDVLLVDDIQFLSGKNSTQEEFFHTFNTLHDANKQIVLTSDRLPKEIVKLEERLRTRFEWGLMGDIQPPDLETRMAILRKKAQSEKVIIPDDSYLYIAERIKSNIRELEGALTKIIYHAKLSDRPVDLKLVSEVLEKLNSDDKERPITAKSVKDSICSYFNISMEDLIGAKRSKELVNARQIAMYLVRANTSLSLPDIGAEFGNKDHSTVLHSVTKVEKAIKENDNLKRICNNIIKDIKEKI